MDGHHTRMMVIGLPDVLCHVICRNARTTTVQSTCLFDYWAACSLLHIFLNNTILMTAIPVALYTTY